MKKSYLLLLLVAFTGLAGCQKDIPVLGQEGGSVTAKSEVYIRSITLHSFPETDPNTSLPWDDGAVQPFDTTDYKGPDIYFYLYHKSDEGHIMEFRQLSHFTNVLPLTPDSPVVYYVVPPFQILPEYIDTTFYLKVNDLDFADPINTTTLIDSLPFTIGPDFNLEDPYITSVSSTGFNGSQVTLGLEWK